MYNLPFAEKNKILFVHFCLSGYKMYESIKIKQSRLSVKFTVFKDMNKEKDFVYLVTVVRSTLSMMFGWLYFYEK